MVHASVARGIIDFVIFEEETSLYYPWKLNSKQISARAERIAALLPDNYTTDDIYDAISQVAGEKKGVLKENRKKYIVAKE